jgi:hypothetical protein
MSDEDESAPAVGSRRWWARQSVDALRRDQPWLARVSDKNLAEAITYAQSLGDNP